MGRKISFTIIQLKQALLNTGQEDRHWTGPYPGFLEKGHQLNWPGAFEGKPTMSPLPNQEQVYILTYFLPTFLLSTRGQASLVQLSQPNKLAGGSGNLLLVI